ncbi:MAG: 4Fe-4S binding protein [Candidatus Sumerlaeota bacterium]|nr:4Fe-4S binding protein [Candidatus Sumerlaeota bacterium]
MFHGSEAALGVFFTAWLFWLGAGAYAGSWFSVSGFRFSVFSSWFSVFGFRFTSLSSEFRVPSSECQGPSSEFRVSGSGVRDSKLNPYFLFCSLFILLPAAGAVELVLLRYARGLTATPLAQIAPLGRLALSVFLAMIPVGALAGVLFPLGCYLRAGDAGAEKQQNVIGRLYGLESLGSCAGGVIFTFWWVGALSPLAILILLLLLSAVHVALDGLTACREDPVKLPSKSSQTRRTGRTRLTRPTEGLAQPKNSIFHGSRRPILPAAIALLCAIVLASGQASRWSRASQRARFAAVQPGLELIEEQDSRNQNIAIARRGDQRVLFCNHKIVASFPDARACEQRAAFAMAQRPDARRILLLGGGMEGLAQELLRYPSVERVVVVEQDEKLTNMIRRHLPEDMRRPLDDARRFGVVNSDPRRFLLSGGKSESDASDRSDASDSGAGAKEKFDLAWIVPSDPSTAWQNRLYTREFFKLLGQRLSARGIVLCSITSAENYLGPDVASYGASVFATLRAAFADVVVSPGDVNTFVACAKQGQASSDWKELARRYAAIRPQGAEFPPDGFAAMLPPDRVAAVRERFERLPATINSDLRPVTYYYNIVLWGHFAGSNILQALKAFERAGVSLILAPLAIALALLVLFRVPSSEFRVNKAQAATRNSEPVTRNSELGTRNWSVTPVVVAGIGLFAMAADMLLLFLYQSLFGSVYERVGFAVSLFMLGMAAGSLLASGFRISVFGLRIGRRRAGKDEPGKADDELKTENRKPKTTEGRARLWLCASLAAMALLAVALPAVMRAGAVAQNLAAVEYGFFGLFLLMGGVCGMAFSFASSVCILRLDGFGENMESPQKQELAASLQTSQTAGWLDATDNWGGALGALLTGAVMVPLFGVPQTAWLLAAIAGAALLAIFIDQLLPEKSCITSRQPEILNPELGTGLSEPGTGLSEPGTRNSELVGWGWILAWACLSIWAVWLKARPVPPAAPMEFPQNILQEISGRRQFALTDKPFPHYRVSDATTKEMIFSSFAVAPGARAWGGPIRLLLDVDEKVIHSARILEQNETPSYVGDLEGWLRRQFEGKEYVNGFDLKRAWNPAKTAREIDGISGATVTSRAILDLLNQSAYAAGTRILGRELDAKQFAVQTWRGAFGTAKNAALAIVFLLLIPAYWLAGARLRTVFLIVNLLVLGWLANQVFTLPHIARLSSGEVFTLASASLLLMTGLVLVSAVFFGSAFCGYICPFGIFQELLSRLGRARAINTNALGGVYRLRYWLLALGLIGFWLSGAAAFTAFDPMQFFFTFEMTKLEWAFVAVIAVGCLRYFRFWCRCFCPVGALISLINRVALFDGLARRRRRAARCPVGMATSREIECLRCNLCVKGSEEARERPIARKLGRDFPAFILAALLLAAIVVWSDFKHPSASQTLLSIASEQGREIDAAKLERGIKQGTIVEKEAKYYKPGP